MEQKTKLQAEDGQQSILITREFDLPLQLLFKAYTEPEMVEAWMGTKVLKLENKNQGGWRFETSDPRGNVVLRMHGVYHDFVPEEKIIRTFEMENTHFPVQLEFLEFEKINDRTSKLKMEIVYRSTAVRDQMLQLPFASGLSGAHDRLEKVAGNLKS